MEYIKKDRKKIIKLLVLIISIVLIITLATFAWITWSSSENTQLTMTIGQLVHVTFEEGNDITDTEITAVLDYNNAKYTAFTVNNKSKDYYKLSINLDITSIDPELQSEHFKYKVLESIDNSNFTPVIEGTFKGITEGSNIIGNISLLSKSTTYYKFVLYIDASEENNVNMMEKTIIGTINVEAKEGNVANSPALVEGLIPVSYEKKLCSEIYAPSASEYRNCYKTEYPQTDIDNFNQLCILGGLGDESFCSSFVQELVDKGEITIEIGENSAHITIEQYIQLCEEQLGVSISTPTYTFIDTNEVYVVVKADKNSNDWYNYDANKWANAILVHSEYRGKDDDVNFDIGEAIPEKIILAHYVWIPRYKYKVFNINKEMGIDSYNAQSSGIDIVFENGTNTTGTIKCTNYSFAAPIATTLNETCSGSNGEYYTHPAFTFGDDELTGIWVGKFEISSSKPSEEYGGGDTTDLSVRIKPNVVSWRENPITNYSKVIQSMNLKNNIYGLSQTVDTHMIKNLEWGAVAYLTHSKYGRCENGVCEKVGFNNYEGYYTGLNYENNVLLSTTGNVYGIYDMNGGTYEYVMANQSSVVGNYTYNSSSGGSNFEYATETAKYIDTYAYAKDETAQTSYNRARLGDATGEIVVETDKGWNDSLAQFINRYGIWFSRGGEIYSDNSDIFTFNYNLGLDNISTRAILVDIS